MRRLASLIAALFPPRAPSWAAANAAWYRGAAELPPRFGRLRRDDPLVRIVGAVGSGEPISAAEAFGLVGVVQKPSGRNWVRAEAAAWALGRAQTDPDCRDRIVAALAGLLQMGQWTTTGCSATLTVGCSLNPLVATPILAYMLAQDGRRNAVRAQAAESLGLLDCVPAIADLARAMSDRNRPGCANVRDAARRALHRLLPLVDPSSYGALPARTEEELCKLLDFATVPTDDLDLPVLQALRHIGAGRSLTTIEHLLQQTPSVKLRRAAADVLPAVRERAARARDAAQLLRPADSPGAPADVLLRPVEAAPSGSAALLVRPVDEQPAPVDPSSVEAARPDASIETDLQART